MKKITLLFAFLITSIGFSQTELLTNGDFANGTDSWGGSGFTVVSGEAFFSSTNAGGDPWDTQLTQGGLAFVNSQEYTLTFYARAAANRQISVAIQNVGAWTDQFRQENIDITTAMAEYTYTFNATSDNGNVQVGFLMAGFGSTDAIYFDDISLTTDGSVPETCTDGIQNNGETGVDCGGPNCDPCPSPPTTAAATPPVRNAWDVISLYSDAYTDVASNFDAGWCGANSVEEVMIAGNATLAWKSNVCQGIVLDAGVDASAFNTAAGTNLHVDLYIQAGTDVTSKVFNLKFVQQPGGAALEINLNASSTPPLVAGSWLSIDVPVDLTTFTGFKEFGVTSANLNNIAWYDNLYVYRDATVLSTDDFDLADFSVYPNPTNNVWNVKTNNTIMNSIQVFDMLGKQVLSLNPRSEEAQIDASTLNSGLYFAKIDSNSGSKTIKLIKN